MKLSTLLFVALSLVVASCGSPTEAAAIPTVVLQRASGGSSRSGAVVASGTVVPEHSVYLSFPLTGTVKTVSVDVGDEVRPGDPLMVLDTVILQARVAQAAAGVAAAEAQLNYLIRQGEDEVHLQSARADIDRAQASLDAAEAVLAQATLRARIGGTVAALDIAPGETATPGQIVAVVGDLTTFQVETTDLTERDIPLVHMGDTAVVLIEALNSETTGTVTDVARISGELGGDVVFKVTVRLDEQPDGIRWGMSAEVRIGEPN